MQNDRLESGGVTFDANALDALLDEDPSVGVERPNDNSVGMDPLPEKLAEQVADGQDDLGRDDVRDQDGDATEPGPDEVAEVSDEDSDKSDEADSDSTDGLEGEEFITDGDEGPMLLTGIGEDGKPIYETASQLFGDHQFQIKAAGEDHNVTFDEMRKGYQRQADYTRAKTEVVQMQRQLQPFMNLVNMWQESGDFREVVSEYIQGSEQNPVSDEALLEAFDSGDREKINALLAKKKTTEERRKAYDAANRVTQEQRKAFALEQNRIANTIIDDYTNTIPSVKSFLTTLGYGDNEVDGLEYADSRLQNLAYLAWRQANPDSNQAIHTKPEQALRQKRRMIVKRPPKPVTAGAGTSTTPSALKTRNTQAAFRKAYKSKRASDMDRAIAMAIPDDLLDD